MDHLTPNGRRCLRALHRASVVLSVLVGFGAIAVLAVQIARMP